MRWKHLKCREARVKTFLSAFEWKDESLIGDDEKLELIKILLAELSYLSPPRGRQLFFPIRKLFNPNVFALFPLTFRSESGLSLIRMSTCTALATCLL
jgi:hypothetical protein